MGCAKYIKPLDVTVEPSLKHKATLIYYTVQSIIWRLKHSRPASAELETNF